MNPPIVSKLKWFARFVVSMSLMTPFLILIGTLFLYPVAIWILFRGVWVSDSRIRGLSLKLSLFIGTSIFLFGAFEFYFYNYVAISDGFGQTKMHENWRLRYGAVPTNSLGLRDEEHRQSGKPVLYVVGDSFTAGHGINDHRDRYANVLETLLEKQWDLILLAKGGWGTTKQLEVYSDISNQRGEEEGVLIWQYYINDIDESGQALGISRPAIYFEAPRVLKPMVDNYHFANFLYWGVFRTVYSRELGQQYLAYLEECYFDGEVWEHHRRQLEQVVALQYQGDLETKAVTQPARKLIVIVYPNLKNIASTRRMSDRVVHFFESQGVSVVDMADLLSEYSAEEITVNPLDGHANKMANRLLAEHLHKHYFSAK